MDGIVIRALVILLLLTAPVEAVTVRQMIGDTRYWPPTCIDKVCVLTGLGGIVSVWTRYVDTNMALGRTFIVRGICASACEIAAERAHAVLGSGAVLIRHAASPVVWD